MLNGYKYLLTDLGQKATVCLHRDLKTKNTNYKLKFLTNYFLTF